MFRFARPVKLLAAAALGLSMLVGCGSAPALDSSELQSVTATSKKGTVSLMVMPDAGAASIIEAIHQAKKSIHLSVYMFTNHDASAQVLAALIERAKAGVEVKVILEAHPYLPASAPAPGQPAVIPTNPNLETSQALIAGGVRVKRSSPKFKYTHEKAMVIDGQVAYVMTLNLTNSGLSSNREYVVVSKDPADAAELETIFQSDWEELNYQPKNANFVVSPNNSRTRLLHLLGSAKKTLTVHVEFLNDPAVVAQLGARVKAGVDVKVMLARFERDPLTGYDPNTDELKLLTDAGVTQVIFSQKIKMHAKAILVDGQRAFVGSENLTTNSMDNNREVGMLFQDPAALASLQATMAKDWQAK